jgi:hypothetical protein
MTDLKDRGEDEVRKAWVKYETIIETWWCGCESFQKSTYHLCKHLIAMILGFEELGTNKPWQPSFGEVWRQTRSPILWVQKCHGNELLFTGTLCPNEEFSKAIDGKKNAENNNADSVVLEDEYLDQPVIYDSSDEEEDGLDNVDPGNSDNDGENPDFGGFDGLEYRMEELELEEEQAYRERERFGEEQDEMLEHLLDDLNRIQGDC